MYVIGERERYQWLQLEGGWYVVDPTSLIISYGNTVNTTPQWESFPAKLIVIFHNEDTILHKSKVLIMDLALPLYWSLGFNPSRLITFIILLVSPN